VELGHPNKRPRALTSQPAAKNGGGAGERLAAHDLAVSLAGATVLRDVGIELPPHSITALVGANGSGKTTLLRTLSRIVKPAAGGVVLDGRDIHRLPTREVARRLALLPQGAESPSGVTVRALVELGRQPHIGRLGTLRRADRNAIGWALAATNLTAFADRTVDSLSGGERQRAWLALALAQRTPLLLLDEPTTYLDVRHQLQVLALVRRLNREHGLTVCWVLHDLNAAAAFSDRLVCLREGRVVAQGAPSELLTPALIGDVFGIEASVIADPRGGHPVCLPHAPSRAVNGAGPQEREREHIGPAATLAP
jgi:ABC-type cobalamin/Fe3+-siderophores transport system ATPase subunit